MELSTPIQSFLDNNLLINILLDCALKLTRPGSTTLISVSGALYSLLANMWDPWRKILGFFMKPHDALQALRQLLGDDKQLDYLVYYLTATIQGFNPKINDLELVMLKKIGGLLLPPHWPMRQCSIWTSSFFLFYLAVPAAIIQVNY